MCRVVFSCLGGDEILEKEMNGLERAFTCGGFPVGVSKPFGYLFFRYI